MFRKDAIKLYVLGIFLLALTAWIFFREHRTDWSDYQAEFRDYVAEKFGEERATQVPSDIQQIWVKDLDRVDRCTTCHQAVEWKGLEDAPEPYRTHPKEILDKHPLNNYGCTSCHGGQGFATILPDAHGNVEHWENPVLGQGITDAYLIKDSKATMQINCNVCHRFDRETKGMDYINLAKNLVQEKNCRACHVINGRGTMAVVLSTQISLTTEERRQAIELLKVAHQRKLEQQTKSANPSPKPNGKKWLAVLTILIILYRNI